jgi:hypothetical protein
MCRFLQLFVAMCVLSTSDTSAQGLTGALIGTVRDAQGGVVSGAVVHVSSPALELDQMKRLIAAVPVGIKYVIVTGVVTVDNEQHRGALAGRVIYGPGKRKP